MWLLVTVAESVFMIFGSLICAILLCMALWYGLRPLHHPELAAIIIGALTIVALMTPFTYSPFFRLTIMFAAIGAVPLWIAGIEWRASQRTTAATRGHDRMRLPTSSPG